MLNITDKAKEELSHIIKARKMNPGSCLRLTVPPLWEGEGDFGIVIDEERIGDVKVSYFDSTLILIDPHLAERLDTSKLDYVDSNNKAGFTLDVF